MGSAISCLHFKGTLFLQAARDGDVAALQQLLSAEAEVIQHRGFCQDNNTAWHEAAALGRTQVLQALHQHLVSHAERQPGTAGHSRRMQPQHCVNRPNNRGRTPLMLACEGGHSDTVALLMSMDADPWITDRCGMRTALHYAAMRGHLGCIAAIVDAASLSSRFRMVQGRQTNLLDMPTTCGFTPLHFASLARKSEAIQQLLEYGANPAALTTLDGVHEGLLCAKWSTPLHVSAKQGHYEAVWATLQHLAARADQGQLRQDPRRLLDVDGRSPYRLALEANHASTAELLHPSLELVAIVGHRQARTVGVPRLALIAAAVVKQTLLEAVDDCSERAATLQLEQCTRQQSAPDIQALHTAGGTQGHQACSPACRPACGESKATCSSQSEQPLIRCTWCGPALDWECGLAALHVAVRCPGAAACQQRRCVRWYGWNSGAGSGATASLTGSKHASASQYGRVHILGTKVATRRALVPAPPVSCPEQLGVCKKLVKLCAVCLDEKQALVLQPCKHRLCTHCLRMLVQGVRDMALVCPLCRQIVQSFEPPSVFAV